MHGAISGCTVLGEVHPVSAQNKSLILATERLVFTYSFHKIGARIGIESAVSRAESITVSLWPVSNMLDIWRPTGSANEKLLTTAVGCW